MLIPLDYDEIISNGAIDSPIRIESSARARGNTDSEHNNRVMQLVRLINPWNPYRKSEQVGATAILRSIADTLSPR